MLKVAVYVLLSMLVYLPSSTSVYGHSYTDCFYIDCKDCRNRTCCCINFENDGNYSNPNQLRCPEIKLQIKYDAITKELQSPCHNEYYHPQFIILKILPRFTNHQIKKLRMCLLKQPLGFGKGSSRISSLELMKILENIKFLEISVRDGVIRQELIRYMLKTIPSLEEISFNNTPIEEPKEKVLKMLTDSGFIKLNGYYVKIMKQAFFELVKTLNEIDLSDNYFKELPDHIFWNLVNVTKIDLINNRLQKLPSKLFRDCVKLEEFRIHNNQLRSLPVDIFNNLKSLRKIVLTKNRLTELQLGLFDNVTNLIELDLSSNYLFQIPNNIFRFNRKLVSINLNFNRFLFVYLMYFTGISENASIYLENNKIGNGMFVVIFPKAKRISLNNNCFDKDIFVVDEYIGEVSLRNCCLNQIPNFNDRINNSLDLRNNNIRTVTMTDLTDSNNLQILDLRENKIEKFDFTWDYPLIQRNQTRNLTTKVLIDRNPIVCNCKVKGLPEFLLKSNRSQVSVLLSNLELDTKYLFCSTLSHLNGKKLKDNPDSEIECSRIILDCPERCHCTINVNTIIIDCKNQNLTNFPKFFLTSDKLTNLHLYFENNNLKNFPLWEQYYLDRIEVISLDNNLIDSLGDFKLFPKLKSLSLKGNRLNNIEPTLKDLLLTKQNISLALSNNPWLCDCDSVLLMTNSDKVIDKEFLKCRPTEANKRQQMKNLKFAFEFCKELNEKGNSHFIYIPISLSVIVCLTFILFYRFKAEIRLWLFTRGWCLSFVSEIDVDENKMFDAFVCYSTDNEEWVAKILVPEMEEGNPPYKLCVHSRDWRGGEWIPEQIVRSVQSSRRTVIVFSKEFVRSCWSRLEFHVAHQQSATDKINRIILIVLGELPDINDLDAEMRMYLKLNTYIKWGEPYFWRKLRCAMPRIRTSDIPTITSSWV